VKPTFLILTLTIASFGQTIQAPTPPLTNATVEAMVSGGISLATIIQTIKAATNVDFLINNQERLQLIKAGASDSTSDQLLEAMHQRVANGVSSSAPSRGYKIYNSDQPRRDTDPIVNTPVPVANVPVPARVAPVSPAAPVPVSAPPVAPVPVSVAVSVPPVPPAPIPVVAHGPVTSVPGSDMLTDSEISDAILKSSLNGRHRIGLMLNDQQTAWASVLIPQGAVSGYTIFVYSPEQWIEQMAVNARREMLPFTADSVTSDMRMKMLHVVAMPSTPEYLNGTGFAFASSVHRIVITDTSRNEIVQPAQLNNSSVTTNSALRSAEFSTANAAFMMTDVERLRALDGKSEFFITVTGSNQNKFFKVKEKFFNTLFQ